MTTKEEKISAILDILAGMSIAEARDLLISCKESLDHVKIHWPVEESS